MLRRPRSTKIKAVKILVCGATVLLGLKLGVAIPIPLFFMHVDRIKLDDLGPGEGLLLVIGWFFCVPLGLFAGMMAAVRYLLDQPVSTSATTGSRHAGGALNPFRRPQWLWSTPLGFSTGRNFVSERSPFAATLPKYPTTREK